jgi:acyl-CoA synthetase (AMP-forming)/AMP-acid ligase II
LLAPEPTSFAALFVSLIAAGVIVVPLDPAAPVAAQRELLARSGARAVIRTHAVRPTIDVDLGVPTMDLRPDLLPPPGPWWPVAPPADRAHLGGTGGVLLFSSGSTGPRKAVLLDEPRLLHVARAVAEHHRLTPADRGYNPLPLFHVNAEVVAVLGSLVSGGALVLDDRFHRTGFVDLIAGRRVTWINAVPAILSILAGQPGETPLPASVRFVRSASAPLPVPVLRRFERRYGVPVLETYGMTEAASQITANPLAGPRKPGSVGLPVGVELRVVEGRVQIRGPGVIDRYPDGEGADRFDADGWLDTGDVGRLDDDGYLFLLGRDGEAINRGGEKLFP